MFAELLAKVNSTEHPRQPGQWTPKACAVWNESEGEARDLIYAALVWELRAERLARPDDEPSIRERMAKIAGATAAANSKTAA